MHFLVKGSIIQNSVNPVILKKVVRTAKA